MGLDTAGQQKEDNRQTIKERPNWDKKVSRYIKGLSESIPYIKGLSEATSRILRKHRISTAMRPCNKLRNILVHPKDKTNEMDKAQGVYKVPCQSCQASYIGETGRKLGTRIDEQKKSRWTKSLTEGFSEPSTEQICNNRPCGKREPRHKLGGHAVSSKGEQGPQQTNKRGHLDQENSQHYE